MNACDTGVSTLIACVDRIDHQPLCHPERSASEIHLPPQSLARSRRIPRMCPLPCHLREFLPERRFAPATGVEDSPHVTVNPLSLPIHIRHTDQHEVGSSS